MNTSGEIIILPLAARSGDRADELLTTYSEPLGRRPLTVDRRLLGALPDLTLDAHGSALSLATKPSRPVTVTSTPLARLRNGRSTSAHTMQFSSPGHSARNALMPGTRLAPPALHLHSMATGERSPLA